MIHRLVLGGALVLLVLAAVTGRVLYSSHLEWRRAEDALASGRLAEARLYLGRAARLHAPGNPWSRRSFAALESLAERAETSGEREEALLAWRELRSAILAARSIYMPEPARLELANRRIAHLAAALEPASPGDDEAARRRWHAERLAEDGEPRRGWALAALVGLGGYLGASFVLLRGTRRRRYAVAIALAGSLLLFAVGLARA